MDPMLIGRAIVSFLKAYWKPLVLLALVAGLFWFGYHTKASIDAREARVTALESENASLRKQKARVVVNERVVTKYVDRVQVVRGRTQTIVKEVPVYVASDAPDLPGGFRVLHDAAAQGILPDPARIADAAPVAAQDVAATVADNYGACQANAEQVTALQDWIRQQQAVK